ncbi:SulP family inorganic anion transporter [Lusitaniella coriacea LEGE 07157]|uniref:SulP family inorganic anion transporter n=1 Tax=Lusitaniella coriacea LEGE 07157 TaxID=945747 RepID=A0A8J7B8G4_9CYAN|nr:SulP family inorganic anion transporter [Lusitaniella coriacea]MBE9115465.1 SulP family inorganic anion transporter [Lusitaniella coriacea LEGE 07157]
MKLVNSLHFRNWRGDLYGGITAAIVALPLALAFGVSSGVESLTDGAGAAIGLYGAICVGFFAALCGGTPSQISGPTGPMTVVMATVFTAIAAKNEDPATGLAIAFTIVMLGGLFQILFGILKLGQYITLMPYTVISGFMSGVGAIIILIEIGPLLGYPGSAGVVDSLSKLPEQLSNPNPIATGLGILTLAIVFLWPSKLNRIVPSPLLALIVATLISVLIFPNSGINKIGNISAVLPQLHFPTLDLSQLRDILGYGLMLATLGSIDSLLTSLVADNITSTQHNSDRELIGQGIGNMVSGLFGGLPGAGATMRTVVNVQTGGKTPLSGIIHALVLLVILFGAGKLTQHIPHAVLAGILIKVGIDIIDWGFLKRAHRVSLRAAAIMYGVLFLTVFEDLITAVVVGVFVANLFTVKRLSDLQSENISAIATPDDTLQLKPEERKLLAEAGGRILLFRLGGPMSFGAAKSISQRMSIVKNYEVLILDLSDVPFVGVTASLAIENIVKEACQKRRDVFMVGASGRVKSRLQRLDILDRMPPSHRVPDRLSALQQAIQLIRGNGFEVNPETNEATENLAKQVQSHPPGDGSL